MKITTPKTITKESLGDEAPDWVDPLVDNLQSIGPIVQALQGQLSFPDNHNAQLKTVTVTIPAPTWTAPTLKNGWSNLGGGYSVAGYKIEPGGRVHLRGVITGGTTANGTTLWTMPAGFQPEYHSIFPAVQAGLAPALEVFAEVRVQSTGEVACYALTSANWLSLDGISFQAKSCAALAPFSGTDWPLVIKTSIKGQAIGVQLLQAIDTGTSTSQSLGAMSLDWENTGANQVRIQSIYGLQPGRTYKLTFLVLGP